MSKPQAVEIGIPMNGIGNGAPAPEPPNEPPQRRQHAGWERNDRNVVLLVATLITTLTYQLGTNLPSGYYQEDGAGYQAGDSILRHKHHHRYWLFMTGSWTGFGSSMLMTLALLTGAPTGSRLIRWPFAVAYSSLVLTFISSQPKTKLSLDILLWIFVLFILWAAVSFKQREMSIPEALGALKGFVRRRFCR